MDHRAWVKVFYKAAIKRQRQCEDQAAALAAEAFSNWLQEGPMCGLKRQHQLSRTATGWIPTKVAQPLANDFEPIDEVDGLSPEQLGSIRLAGQEEAPLTAQQIANDEKCKWGAEWAVGEQWSEPDWSEFEANEDPLPISVREFRWALMTFPAGTGLGWDAIHPRALNRLDDATIQALIDLIIVCEKVGEWPSATDLVVVALLPKTDGGWRPIGLLPFLPRIQMRVRRPVTLQWERCQARDYLYAGAAKGATVAAWKQSARGERAHLWGTSYGQALLDLAKAFERIQHKRLVRQAVKLGYPMWMVRLSIATYRMRRVLRIGDVVSDMVVATRGITAGSGTATTEMRLAMIDIIDYALEQFPCVGPTLCVDDVSAEVAGPDKWVARNLGGFIRSVCDGVREAGMDISTTKSVCTASSPSLTHRIASDLREYDIKPVVRTKSLGVGLAAGNRRNASVINKRLKDYKKRLARFRMLRQAGVDTNRLNRTGGTAALVWGQEALGVPPSTLQQQRRAVAAAGAAGSGMCGQDLDLALILADGSATGMADPAFAAHSGPLGHWAMAVWNEWRPIPALNSSMKEAISACDKAAHPWRIAYGPAAATYLSARRLGWSTANATAWTTDRGRHLDLRVDPPAVIIREVHDAVRRWRWRALALKYPSLSVFADGEGAVMEPIWKLLRSTTATETWNSDFRAALKSLICARQWSQQRYFSAGWGVGHNRCLFCVHQCSIQAPLVPASVRGKTQPRIVDRRSCDQCSNRIMQGLQGRQGIDRAVSTKGNRADGVFDPPVWLLSASVQNCDEDQGGIARESPRRESPLASPTSRHSIAWIAKRDQRLDPCPHQQRGRWREHQSGPFDTAIGNALIWSHCGRNSHRRRW